MNILNKFAYFKNIPIQFVILNTSYYIKMVEQCKSLALQFDLFVSKTFQLLNTATETGNYYSSDCNFFSNRK